MEDWKICDAERCGDGVHSVVVSHKTLVEIRGGKEITLQGDGFVSEEGTIPDYREFNGVSLAK